MFKHLAEHPFHMSQEDRVAELESTVAELRATVDGLTEELVESRERLRQLESATDGVSVTQSTPLAADPGGNGAAATADEGTADADAETTGADAADVIDADADDAAADETEGNAAESEASDAEAEGVESGDDIIVA